MDFFRNNKAFALILALALAAGAGHLLLGPSDEGGDSLLTSSGQTGPSATSRELLATLGDLKTVKLINTLFADPLFVSLSDFGVQIPLQPKGRSNPFAPIGARTATPPVPSR